MIALALPFAATARPAGAASAGYPLLGLYGSMMGNGYPLWDSTGALQSTALDEMARYHEVILDISPITPYRPDAIAALRARNPDISLLAYVTGSFTLLKDDPDSLGHFPTLYNHTVRDLDGFLYNTSGQQYPQCNVNLAKRSPTGRYVVAEALADLFYNRTIGIADWNGIFIDIYCDQIAWMETPAQRFDYQRAGYSSLAALDIGWKAGSDTLANRLRRLAGSSAVLVGNCASGSKYVSFNGWMRENFPYQQGGNWYSNMYWDPGGYFADEAKFRAPTHNYIYSAGYLTDPYGSSNTRKVRFTLGTASLGSGFGAIGPPDRRPLPSNYQSWWFDEYAVDLATGQSSAQLAHTGWLGMPLAPYYQMIWVGTNPDAASNPGFETDLTAWGHGSVIGSTLSRDVTTAAVGSASAHVTVPTTSSVPWAVSFSTTGTIPVNLYQAYAATFWARAAVARSIRVALGGAVSGEFASTRLTIDMTWKQYQIALISNGTGPSRLSFQLGTDAGDVWLDDCHLQAGATTIYRRDFQNGTVLVNPSDNYLSVPLERQFRRISGAADPTVNNGGIVTQVTLAPSDALFLIGSDQIPPAMVNDLRRVP